MPHSDAQRGSAIASWRPAWEAMREALDAFAETGEPIEKHNIAKLRDDELVAWDGVDRTLGSAPDEKGLFRSPNWMTLRIHRGDALALDDWLTKLFAEDWRIHGLPIDPVVAELLDDLLAYLEPRLAETFRPDYGELLGEARRDIQARMRSEVD